MNNFTKLVSKTTTIGQSHKQMCENIWHKNKTPEKQSEELKEKLKTTIPDQQICLNH